MYKYIGRFMMNILLSKTEQDLLFLLEELTKHHDWIEIPDVAKKLNFSIEELQEHLLSLNNYFQTSYFNQAKKAFNCSLTSKTPWIPGLRFLNNLKPTLF